MKDTITGNFFINPTIPFTSLSDLLAYYTREPLNVNNNTKLLSPILNAPLSSPPPPTGIITSPFSTLPTRKLAARPHPTHSLPRPSPPTRNFTPLPSPPTRSLTPPPSPPTRSLIPPSPPTRSVTPPPPPPL